MLVIVSVNCLGSKLNPNPQTRVDGETTNWRKKNNKKKVSPPNSTVREKEKARNMELI